MPDIHFQLKLGATAQLKKLNLLSKTNVIGIVHTTINKTLPPTS